MASYQLSRDADARITDIYAYSLRNWGLDIAQDYFLGLHDCFENLANNPELGRSFHEFRRFEFRSHVIFYSEIDGGIRIEQIYHKAQDIDGLF